MAKRKRNFVKAVTPVGVAAFSRVHKPDTEGDYADGKYKTMIVIDPVDQEEALARYRSRCQEAAKAKWGEVPGDLDDCLREGDEKAAKDEKYASLAGKLTLNTKSQYQPGFVDADREPLPEGVWVSAGDVIRASVALVAYESTETVKEGGKRKTVTVHGVSPQLRTIQLLEKRASGGRATDFEDDLEGYRGFGGRPQEATGDGDSDDYTDI